MQGMNCHRHSVTVSKFTLRPYSLYCLCCINIQLFHVFFAVFKGAIVLTASDSVDAGAKRVKFLALADEMRHAVWRASSLGRGGPAGLSSGYPALDAELPGGGWAASSLTELLWSHQGGGEFRILAPALRSIAQAGKTIVLLGSPHDLIAPGLDQAGIDVSRILIVRAEKPADRLWSAEQILKSGCVGALVSWHPMAKAEHLRRLQVAATATEGFVFICRPASTRQEASPAPLRLLCEPAQYGQLSVDVFKRRGPSAAAPVLLPPLFSPSMTRALERAQRAAHHPTENKNVDRVPSTAAAAGPGVPALA